MSASTLTTVDAYLAALKAAFGNAPPALIRDALSDAEEHLRNELAQNPTKSEADVLAAVIENYGTPGEIAEEYRSMEQVLAGAGPFPRSEEEPSKHDGFFGVIVDPRAYSALIYMLLSIALGIFYFTWTVTGLSLSLGFMILIIGIPFALLFIGSIRVLSLVEGRIVEGLLGVRMPRRLPPEHAEDETVWKRIKAALADVRTWSSMAYFLLMLPLGVAYFTVATTFLTTSVASMAGSVHSLITGQDLINMDSDVTSDLGTINGMDAIQWLHHFLNTAPGLVVLFIFGLLLLFVTLHIARAIGWIHGQIAEVLLVRL